MYVSNIRAGPNQPLIRPVTLSLNVTCSITRIVESMTLLMESNLIDGEEAATISSEYVQASCLVTSGADGMSFDAGEPVLFGFSLDFNSLFVSVGSAPPSFVAHEIPDESCSGQADIEVGSLPAPSRIAAGSE